MKHSLSLISHSFSRKSHTFSQKSHSVTFLSHTFIFLSHSFTFLSHTFCCKSYNFYRKSHTFCTKSHALCVKSHSFLTLFMNDTLPSNRSKNRRKGIYFLNTTSENEFFSEKFIGDAINLILRGCVFEGKSGGCIYFSARSRRSSEG